MNRILTIVGARPQFVKAAAVSRSLKQHGIEEILVHTGQHYDANMSEVFFEEMEIPKPAYHLDIHGLNHGAMTGRMLEGIETILLTEKPEALMVFGDTNSTLSGALAASKLHIPVIHVEAGLRSFNRQMPEEINRILTDRVSDILFCPTDTAVQNLDNEGFRNFPVQLVKSGDVMLDAALFYARKAALKSTIIEDLGLKEFVLATIHRQENTDDVQKLRQLIEGLNEINRQTPVVLPLHPRTRAILQQNGIELQCRAIDPVGYFDMIRLLQHCQLVVTDSGGVQKEAFFFRKHCITLREQTEWTELVTGGFNTLAGTDKALLMAAFEKAKTDQPDFFINLYGNGHASDIIADTISKA
ncbi:MAG: UDP-N-acetylglucosamine 2-epimerase (non-hydrolyzing) [Bacteroidota bacterium]|nr:UDP-N-acetylglucosamine 2-epimerase (non-hydrolyzing) [Bacteroidota bacterium]